MRRPLAIALAASSVLTALVAVAPPATSAPVRPGPLVTSQAFALHDPGQTARSATGYGAIRLWDTGTTWADLQPERGAFAWGRLDALVARARAQHVSVTLVLGSTPAWAATNPTSPGADWLAPGSSSPPRSEDDWSHYVAAVATRYRGRIDSYQVWNEGALPTFWRGTPDGLARLTQLATARVHAADRAAVVVATPLLPRQKAWTTWSKAYLLALAKRRWPVDVLAVHSYQPDAIATPDGRFVTLRRTRELLAAVHAPARPLWDTEANYTSAAFVRRKVSGQQAADWVARAYLDSLRSGVARTYWYSWNAPVGPLGITMGPGTTGARSYTAVRGWLVGSTYQGCTTTRARTRVLVTSCAFRRGTRTSWVVWASANARTALPVRGSTVCPTLTPCRPVTRSTFASTSPVLVR